MNCLSSGEVVGRVQGVLGLSWGHRYESLLRLFDLASTGDMDNVVPWFLHLGCLRDLLLMLWLLLLLLLLMLLVYNGFHTRVLKYLVDVRFLWKNIHDRS